MRVLSVLDRYLVQLKADGRSPYWQSQIDRHVRLMDRWFAAHRLPRDVRRITHEHVARFLASPEATMRRDGRPKQTTSTNCLRTSVKVFLTYTHAAGHSPRNAAALVRRAKCAPPPPRALPPDDVEGFLATIDAAEGATAERDSALFHTLAETGARIGSLLAAHLEDLDLRHGELLLRHTKGDRPTILPLPRGLCRRLRTYLAGRTSGPLFTTKAGRPLGGRQARRRMTIWLAKAGCRPASPHALRHSYAVKVYKRSGDIAAVQAALNQLSVASAAIYARSGAVHTSGLRGRAPATCR
jgi:site-specific recombinase XerC